MAIRFIKGNYYVVICILICILSFVLDVYFFQNKHNLNLFGRSGALLVIAALFAEARILKLRNFRLKIEYNQLYTEMVRRDAKKTKMIGQIYKILDAKIENEDYELIEDRDKNYRVMNKERDGYIEMLNDYDKFDSKIIITIIIFGTIVWAYGDILTLQILKAV